MVVGVVDIAAAEAATDVIIAGSIQIGALKRSFSGLVDAGLFITQRRPSHGLAAKTPS